MNVNILIGVRVTQNMAVYFPERAMEEIRKLGNVRVLDFSGREHWSLENYAGEFEDVDIFMSHWGYPHMTPDVLSRAPRLKLVAHCTGSVANLVNDAVYERGIKVCSANSVMAVYVAEGALAYILAGLRAIPWHDAQMKKGELWAQNPPAVKSLFGANVGLVGQGTVGMYLLNLLKPFNVKIKIFDPYLKPEALSAHPEAALCTLEEALAWGDVISLHASLTQETRGMMGADQLKLVKDGALLVNTARGAVIDQAALAAELATGRFSAVLDVYEHEPLPVESPLRKLDNAILMPHMAGLPAREEMTFAMIGEVGRFLRNEPLQYEIPYGKFKLMTKE